MKPQLYNIFQEYGTEGQQNHAYTICREIL